MWFLHVFLVSIAGYSVVSGSHADANRNQNDKPVLVYAVRGSEPESKNARSIPSDLRSNYDGLQSNARLIPNAGIGSDNYRTSTGFLNPGLNAYNPGLSAYNPGLSAYNPGLSAYNPGLSAYNPGLGAYNLGLNIYNPGLSTINPMLGLYNPLLNIYNPAMQPYPQMNPLMINPLAISPLSQIGLAGQIQPLGMMGIGAGVGAGIGTGIGTIPFNSGMLNQYQLQGGLGVNSQGPYSGSATPLFRGESQSSADRSTSATSGAFGSSSSSGKRSSMVDPQSPYYTRLYSNQGYSSHADREELDKKRNIGRSRSASSSSIHPSISNQSQP